MSWMRLTAIFTDSVLPDITITIRRVHHDPPMKSWRHALGVTHSLGETVGQARRRCGENVIHGDV